MWQLYIILFILAIDIDKVICGQMITTGKVTMDGVTYESGDVDTPYLTSNTYQSWDSGKCVEKISVSGKGVKDDFSEPCSDTTVGSFSTDYFEIIGDPRKHSLSLYRDQNTNGRLTIVRSTGCSVRSYVTSQAVTTYTEAPMDERACTALKAKMIDELEKNRLYWENKKTGKNKNYKSPPPPSQSPPPPQSTLTPQPLAQLLPIGNGPSLTPTYNKQNGNEEDVSSAVLTVRSRVLSRPGPCKQVITAVGKGVRDTFIEPCTQNDADSINRNGITVFGDPYKLPFCLFSDKQNTLIVVKNKVCTLKTYKTSMGVTTSTRSPMSISKCSQIRNIMRDTLKSKLNYPQQQESRPVLHPQQQLLPGLPNIVALPYLTQAQVYPMPSQSPMAPLLPQPLTPPVQSSPVINTINNVGSMDSSTTSTVTYRPAGNRVSTPSISTTTNNYNNDAGTTREIIIVGNGINDFFKYNTQSNALPESVEINNIFAFRDQNVNLNLFTDTPGQLWVLSKDKCFKRTYETRNGQTKITSAPMKEGECATVMAKLTNHLGGGQVYNLGEGQQNMNWKNYQITNWNTHQNMDSSSDEDSESSYW